MLLSGGLNCDARKSSPRNNQTAAAPKRRPAVAAPTSLGLRCDQRQIRAGGETGRATIGRPPSQRSRSAARSPADLYRAFGSRSRQRAQIVSKSRSSDGASERNLGACVSDALRITETALEPRNGGRPASTLNKTAPRLYTSAAGVRSVAASAACSGAIKPAV